MNDFLNALGFVGTGHGGELDGPLSVADGHEFGSGLPTLYELSRSRSWVWSAPEIEVLMRDARGRQAVWRVRAELD